MKHRYTVESVVSGDGDRDSVHEAIIGRKGWSKQVTVHGNNFHDCAVLAIAVADALSNTEQP